MLLSIVCPHEVGLLRRDTARVEFPPNTAGSDDDINAMLITGCVEDDDGDAARDHETSVLLASLLRPLPRLTLMLAVLICDRESSS